MKSLRISTYFILFMLSFSFSKAQVTVIGGSEYNSATNIYSHCHPNDGSTTYELDLTVANPELLDVSKLYWVIYYVDEQFNFISDTVYGVRPQPYNIPVTIPQLNVIVIYNGIPGTDITIFSAYKPAFNLQNQILCNGTPLPTLSPDYTSPAHDLFGRTHAWRKTNSSGTIISSTLSFSPSDTGTYYYTGSFLFLTSCATQKMVQVKNISPQVVLPANIQACTNQETVISNQWNPVSQFSGTLNYSWNNASYTSESTYTTNSNGIVTLQLKAEEMSTTCLSNTGTSLIEIAPTPFVDLGNDMTIEEDEVPVLLENLAPNGSREQYFIYRWEDTSGTELNTTAQFLAYNEGIYILNITDSNSSCNNADEIRIKFKNTEPEPEPGDIFIATAFSPKSNITENRYLKIKGKNISPDDFSFVIFNRWGNIVFETHDIIEAYSGWDGQEHPAGIYTYTVSGEFTNGEKINKAGTSTLIK